MWYGWHSLYGFISPSLRLLVRSAAISDTKSDLYGYIYPYTYLNPSAERLERAVPIEEGAKLCACLVYGMGEGGMSRCVNTESRI